MSEPFLERLSRFTPDAGSLDRDALLFAAGRASARPNRRWMTLTSLLAATQMFSLVLLWPRQHANLPTGGSAVAITTEPAPPPAPEAQAFEAVASSCLWSAHRTLRESESEDRPPANVNFVDSGPPLRASGPIPPSLLN